MGQIINRRRVMGGGGGIDYSKQYLTYTALDAGTLYFQIGSPFVGPISTDFVRSISYSTDGGNSWVTLENSGQTLQSTLSVNSGDRVLLKGDAFAYMDSNTGSQAAVLPDFTYTVSGNILSMLYGDRFIYENSLPILSGFTFASFFADSSVIDASNLILPAMTVHNCYTSMFVGCTSLTTAPSLPATTLAEGCYEYMFAECTSLNYIKCLATDISANGCTEDWVNGVSAGGTFVKDANMTSWTTGTSGIPSGWTVQNG